MDMHENILLYKSFLIFKGTILAAFVWFFEPIYDVIILNGFMSPSFISIMSDLKELIGFVVAILIAVKLILQIKNIKKDK